MSKIRCKLLGHMIADIYFDDVGNWAAARGLTDELERVIDEYYDDQDQAEEEGEGR